MNVLLQQPTTTTTNSHRGEECLYLILRCNLLLFFVILLLYFIYLNLYMRPFLFIFCANVGDQRWQFQTKHTHTREMYMGRGALLDI